MPYPARVSTRKMRRSQASLSPSRMDCHANKLDRGCMIVLFEESTIFGFRLLQPVRQFLMRARRTHDARMIVAVATCNRYSKFDVRTFTYLPSTGKANGHV